MPPRTTSRGSACSFSLLWLPSLSSCPPLLRRISLALSIRIAKRFPASPCIHGVSSRKRCSTDDKNELFLSCLCRSSSCSFVSSDDRRSRVSFSSTATLSHPVSSSTRLKSRRDLTNRLIRSSLFPDSGLSRCIPRCTAPSFEIHLFGSPPVDSIPFPPLQDYPEYVQFGMVALVYLLSAIYLRKPRY